MYLYAHTRKLIRTYAYMYAHMRILIRTCVYSYAYYARFLVNVYLSGTVRGSAHVHLACRSFTTRHHCYKLADSSKLAF